MKCLKCFWRDYYKICPRRDHQIPGERNYLKDGFLWCHDCGAVTQKREDVVKPISIPPLKRRTKKRIYLINFHSFQIALYLTLVVIGFQLSF